jgi:hypothetical protein
VNHPASPHLGPKSSHVRFTPDSVFRNAGRRTSEHSAENFKNINVCPQSVVGRRQHEEAVRIFP